MAITSDQITQVSFEETDTFEEVKEKLILAQELLRNVVVDLQDLETRVDALENP